MISPTPVMETNEMAFSFVEVANHLKVSPDTLHRLSQRFARFLGSRVDASEPRYTSADVAALVTVQKLLAQGYDDEAITHYLTPAPVEVDSTASTMLAPPIEKRSTSNEEPNNVLPKAVNDVLSTIANSQQAVLNSQSTVREMLNVVVQDNFNLKDENRKLRERMLELERVLAEYQRREETRKERLEGRLRALEGTMAALQQQLAQLVQFHRQERKRRGWWFG
jgi:flagellar capping protein FliD